MFIDSVRALAFLGLPLGIFTFFMAYYAYYKGYISHEHSVKSAFRTKKDPSNTFHKKNKHTLLFLHSKWVSFGGGFYGLVALLTFIYIELKQAFDFFINATGLQYFIDFISISSLVGMIVDSFVNMIKALLWFSYWPDVFSMGNQFIWGIIAYICYRAGAKLAQVYAANKLKLE